MLLGRPEENSDVASLMSAISQDDLAINAPLPPGTVLQQGGFVVGEVEPSQLLLEADEALRAAKRDGKNRALAYS